MTGGPTLHIFGLLTYGNKKFINAMNARYAGAKNMTKIVATIRNAGYDPETIEWGEYQPLFLPTGFSKGDWLKAKNTARKSLASQANSLRLSPDDSSVPLTKCALLDAAVQKCFSANPPITIQIDVQSSSFDGHDINLVWTTDPKTNAVTQLNLTMLCPPGSQ